MRMFHWAILILIGYVLLFTPPRGNSCGSRKQAPLRVLISNALEHIGLPATARNIRLVRQRLEELGEDDPEAIDHAISDLLEEDSINGFDGADNLGME